MWYDHVAMGIELINGTGHDCEFRGKRGTVTLSKLLGVEAFRASTATEREPRQTMLMQVGDRLVNVPVFELKISGFAERDKERMIGHGAMQHVVLMSRIAERAAVVAADENIAHIAHPAYMQREWPGGPITQARFAARPVRRNYEAVRSESGHLWEMRRSSVPHLVNASPQALRLLLPDGALIDIPSVSPYGVDYDYWPDQTTDQGIILAHSQPKELTGVPNGGVDADVIFIAHSEVPVAAMQLGRPGVYPHLAVACGMQRDANGVQTDVCTGIAQYSPETMEFFAQSGI